MNISAGRSGRGLGALALLILLGVVLLRVVPSSAQTSTTATVVPSDGLNLRAEANTQATIVTAIPAGATVTITGSPSSDGWYPVTYAGSSGWVDGAYLALGQPGGPAPAGTAAAAAGAAAASAPPAASMSTSTASATPTMVVDTDELNLRSGPDASSSVITTVTGGTIVQVTGAASGTWLPVTVNGVSGWMDSDFLSPVPTASAAAQNIPAAGPPGQAATLTASPAAPASATAAASPTVTAAPAATPPPSSAASTGPVVPVSLTLTSTAGQPIAGVSFTLAPQQGGAGQTQVTDQSGHAFFSQVAPAIYSLTQAPGAGTSFSSMTINGASATAGQLFQLEAGGSYVIAVVDTQSSAPAAAVPAGTPIPATPGGR